MGIAEHIGSLLHGDRSRRAVQYEGEWFSWGLLGDIADAIDRELSSVGLGADATIGLVLRERPWTIGAFYGLLSTRRRVLTVAPLQPDATMRDDIKALGLAALIADIDDWSRPGLIDTAAAVGTMGIELTHAGGEPVRLIEGLEHPTRAAHHELSAGCAVTLLTSGTTGPPKRIPVFYDELDRQLAVGKKSSGGVTINALPMVSMGGVFALVSTAIRERPISVMDRFDVWKWAELVREHKPRRTGAPPAVLKMVLDADIPAEYFASVERHTGASAPLDPIVAEEFERRYGVQCLQGYGATEMKGSVTGWSEADRARFAKAKGASVGRPLAGVELRVVDPDTGAELPTDEVGRLEVFRPDFPGDHWMSTNDLGQVDHDGFLWIVGRTDDVIIRGGFKVPANEVEEALCEHPTVSDAVVVGLPDDRLGQVPAAVVVFEPDVAASERELIDFVRERVAPYKVPIRVVAVDSIPRNAMLKINRLRVRELITPA